MTVFTGFICAQKEVNTCQKPILIATEMEQEEMAQAKERAPMGRNAILMEAARYVPLSMTSYEEICTNPTLVARV